MPAPIWKLDAGGVAYLIEIRRVAKYMLVLLERHFEQPKKTSDEDSDNYMILDEKHRQLLAEIPEGYHLEMMHLPFRNLYVSQKQIQKDGLTEDEVLAEVMNFIGYIDKDLIKYKKSQDDYSEPTLDEIGEYINEENSSATIKPNETHIVVTDTPNETIWMNMRFQFTGRHSLHVSVPRPAWARNNMSPKDFGLERSNGRPKVPWIILQTMSLNEGRFPLQNLPVGIERESKRRQLTELSHTLQEVFPNVVGGRALRPTYDGMGYECAFTLIPMQNSDAPEQAVDDQAENDAEEHEDDE
ncbi:MAG: hypothetical protein UY67_C0038G0001 [Candidatus Kaiserbacteria bacterium GW2011_GWA2_52_12]|uniref:Uncharacterized protein n=1 Tax=Candidatus Kaiserbacteria bacterium GW2011_GWA2_52_12 TaxID=1618671 RepID=A0A0G1Z5D1_9BACT|nr:MAG: hypothetical protein UY67_C0038G0001 [Candidatus Kaiserbacteria bacterium GW2011_GWA2_52_12]